MDGARGLSISRLAGHGGRLSDARALYPDAPAPWIDLSTGINPWPYSAPRASTDERARLPDPSRLADLERTAASAFGVGDSSRVVATGGTELALRLLPAATELRHAAIVGPTYGSHLDAWRSSGAGTQEARSLLFDSTSMAHSALVIVNPNNPDGRQLARERLLALHDTLRERDGALIVDEAFIEVAPHASVAELAGSTRAPKLVVLRSFGKFYGLAGVRLGFAIASQTIASRLRSLLGDWPVSADALAAGLAAYRDVEWAMLTRERLGRAANRLDALFERCGLTIVGGTSLFRLVRCDDAARRFERLLRAGILVRPFQHDASLLRFGLPRGAEAWRRLEQALSTPQ